MNTAEKWDLEKKMLAWNRLPLANGIRNLIVRLEVAVDSVHRLVDSLDKGAQANAERILPLELLVTQLQCLLHKWEMPDWGKSGFKHLTPLWLCQL